MDRNKRVTTPSHNPNASLFVSRNSATKNSSTSRGLHLNETVCMSSGSSDRNEHPRIKFALSSSEVSSQILETECDLAYNDYLQALMKQDIIRSEIKQQKQVLEGQMILQNENLRRRKDAHNETLKEIDLLKQQIDLVELINSLEANIQRLKTIYSSSQTKSSVEKIVILLQSESDKVVFKNVKLLKTQDEYDKLIAVLKHLNSTMEKIMKSGRNFIGINNLAKEIIQFLELSAKVHTLQTVSSDLEKDALNSLLQTLSDNFAKQYDETDYCQ